MLHPIRKTEVRRLVTKKLKSVAFVNLKKKLTSKQFNISEIGNVLSVKDGVAQVYGLRSVKAGELVCFNQSKVYGMALNLEKEIVGVVVLGEDYLIKQGATVRRTRQLVSIQVNMNLLGRVVDPLGRPIDGHGPITKNTKK
jgi:F0F1-type ATP synthase alpha subunit